MILNSKKVSCDYCGVLRLTQNIAAHQAHCIERLEVCRKCGLVQKGIVDSVFEAVNGVQIWTRAEKRVAHAATHRDVVVKIVGDIDEQLGKSDFVSEVEDIHNIMQPSF